MPIRSRQGAVIVPFSGIGRMRLGRRLRPALGFPSACVREKSDWAVSHSALPGQAWWVTSAHALLFKAFYNNSYKEPRHE